MNLWTNEEIAKILIQLDERKEPFVKYSFSREGTGLKLLGRGGSADVFEAKHRFSHKCSYAIKVIGFRNQNIDSAYFNEAVQAQKEIGLFHENVVKVYDHVEMWVTLDENDNVVSAAKKKPEEVSRTTLRLQFVLMEKISSVISRTKGGNMKLNPEQLGSDEQEVLRFAYDIGNALKSAHKEKVLHRDVKLENVFYSEKKHQYRLGDFGIAKKTEDGFAGTIAFTKGYAAPEVRISDERYDNTADIYSFGMMLYVLVNNLKFPDASTYNVNSSMQYSSGYRVPYPEQKISEEFYHMIAKACMYDPDQRYQSMDEMILDIEKLMYGTSVGYKKENKNETLIVGLVFLALGAVAWKLTFAPETVVWLSFIEYAFWIGCFGKGSLKLLGKHVTAISIVLLGLGIYLLITTGVTWLKVLLVIWMVCSTGVSAGYLSTVVLLTAFMSHITFSGGMYVELFRRYNWVACALLSFSIVLLYQYAFMKMRDRKSVKLIFHRVYWIVICVFYLLLFLDSQTVSEAAWSIGKIFLDESMSYKMPVINLEMVGITGLLFSIFWIIRERILILHQKNKGKQETT